MQETRTRKQQVSIMIDELENDLVKQEVVHDYRKWVYENDERLKGNTEAQKEVKASEFSIERTKKMIKWLNDELICLG